ncbi:molybdenum cofactor guanylyltransferase MobA [Caballeronia sp. LZ062]|uniref:molybdenum cofactor guanylyltransferase MobA n=1 Tax=unclassified Caballeronia TaxID=2646786 RepID=UPI00285D76FA|nr:MULTISPECIES: molybdenum cofactor guanylyltransferase MobA [unclassified Caballeronia]MDR5855027.1 molybdenum cofactor guanylyltransferase MobA [Caballeronia sp. LZ050]MDR5870444.1 molybdenum cofactor guanylyltransferase MobA [Caballeronia sp. LZ062]
MGGVDKGMQPFRGEPLALHVLRCLAPQASAMLISANRNIEAYSALAAPFGARVIVDALGDYPGPLAGIAAALRAAQTEFVLLAPCDAPFVDQRLGHMLGEALDAERADIAYAATIEPCGERIAHPVFALVRTSLADDLDARLASGERKVRAWYARHKAVQVPFHDDRAFYNINDLRQLAELERR